MRQTTRKQIGDHTFEVRQLGAREGAAALFRLTKIAAPAFSALAKSGGNAWGEALSGASESDFTWLLDTMAGCTKLLASSGAGVPLTAELQDQIFRGRYVALLEWLYFALEVNFGDFFEEAASRAGLAGLVRKGEAAEPLPQGSTGTSGGSS